MGNASATVQRLSPLHYKHLALKASMREYDGWLRAENYGAPAEVEAEKALSHVGVCDVSPIEKLDIKGRNIDTFLEHTLASKDVPRMPSDVSALAGTHDGAAYTCRLTKEHAMMIGQPKQQEPIRSPLDAPGFAATDRCYLTNMTSVLAGLNIIGPSSTELLKELTQLDLSSRRERVQWCSEGGLAKVRSIVVRTGATSFDLFFGRDYAEYVWDELIHLGTKYSISPFGVAAYRLIHDQKETTQ
jgi:glycine cleavage system aminomethyltransferase T